MVDFTLHSTFAATSGTKFIASKISFNSKWVKDLEVTPASRIISLAPAKLVPAFAICKVLVVAALNPKSAGVKLALNASMVKLGFVSTTELTEVVNTPGTAVVPNFTISPSLLQAISKTPKVTTRRILFIIVFMFFILK